MDILAHCTTVGGEGKQGGSSNVQRSLRTLLNLPEGCPGCVIPRRLRGQPGRSARYPTPCLAFPDLETYSLGHRTSG